MISTAEIGMTDCTTLIGIHGRLTSASVCSTGRIQAPTAPRSAKKAITTISAAMLNARRAPHGMASTTSGHPMWARFTDASAEP